MAKAKVSYRAKRETVCPVCGAKFRREDLLTGGGRMNAGSLTNELHRIYLPTVKFGLIFPLIYPVTVCPKCWYAAYPTHFDTPGENAVGVLVRTVGKRKNVVRPVFADLDFEKERRLEEGIASYVLAALCYEHLPPECTPTFLRGLSFLRAGWLANAYHTRKPQENFDYMANIFLRKASFFYRQVLEGKNSRAERVEELAHHGPDLDNNYGYDGILYLSGVLELKYGQRDDPVRRAAALKAARSAISRIVGMGRISKSKPSALLDMGRELHKSIKSELDTLERDS